MASASLSRRAEASLNEYNHVSRSYLQTATILVKNQIFFSRFLWTQVSIAQKS